MDIQPNGYTTKNAAKYATTTHRPRAGRDASLLWRMVSRELSARLYHYRGGASACHREFSSHRSSSNPEIHIGQAWALELRTRVGSTPLPCSKVGAPCTGTFIPASQRPDGTWRKQRRVKDGYIPQEEVPLYESKGKQLVKKPLYPVGASPEFIAEHKAKLEALAGKNKIIPGLQSKPQEGSKKKKKKNKSKVVEGPVTEGLSKLSISEPEFHKEVTTHNDKPLSITKQTTTNNIVKDISNTTQKTTTDPQKRLKNLRKKIREIEVLEEKIKTGALKNPDKEILDKVARKIEISKEIKRLEAAP
ncbi:partner of Y14 and mago isoform X2 [Nylanderia fulva]|uniref:partner of Y14 and mago isoform X2 n=1 Tax=Nylanderia fulva TaxID=613905 RepID=UPI0010FB9DB5|nr:partner of Y14 and mago isoform X2 [Nylanderia fulva]